MAFHHPIRRWLTELLGVDGPANVGQLAAATGLAVGSVSHHLKVLHQQDLIEPAPDLARDTRESWWKLKPRAMTLERRGLRRGHPRAGGWPRPPRWRTSASRSARCRSGCGARPDESPGWRMAAALHRHLRARHRGAGAGPRARLSDLFRDWSADCMAAADEHPDVARRPVRAIARVFPSDPVGRERHRTAPELIGPPPPPVRKDPMVLVWLAAVGLSWFGDFAWTVALAWTAAHTLSPVLAGVVLGAEMLPQALLVLIGGVLADRYDPRGCWSPGRSARRPCSSWAPWPGPRACTGRRCSWRSRSRSGSPAA